jgi:hypothetical protein
VLHGGATDATLEGVGCGRAVARLTESHDAYRWICGGVQVNYHTLCDFRSRQGEALDDLLTDNVASLMAAGAVKLKGCAQDGMRVRASAGAASFRREETLKACREEARQQVAKLKAQLDDDPVGESARTQAAQQRAVAEREARIEAALDRLPELAAIKKGQGKEPDKARSSTTDAAEKSYDKVKLTSTAGCRTLHRQEDKTMPAAISTARLEARISTDLHSMLKRAAELQGRTMTD